LRLGFRESHCHEYAEIPIAEVDKGRLSRREERWRERLAKSFELASQQCAKYGNRGHARGWEIGRDECEVTENDG
jgi:hypothetical protein